MAHATPMHNYPEHSPGLSGGHQGTDNQAQPHLKPNHPAHQSSHSPLHNVAENGSGLFDGLFKTAANFMEPIANILTTPMKAAHKHFTGMLSSQK